MKPPPPLYQLFAPSVIDEGTLQDTLMKRFNHHSVCLSKKLDSLAAAFALHVAHYSFCRVHGSLNKITPAMAAGIADELWTIDDLYDVIMG